MRQPEPGEEEYDGFLEMRDQAARERMETTEELRLLWEEAQRDPLISALNGARRAKEQAEQEIRELLAYGREFVQPRPYTLGDLAAAAGMSISGGAHRLPAPRRRCRRRRHRRQAPRVASA